MMVLLNQCLRMGLEELCCFRWDLKARPLAVSKKAFPALQLVCYALKGGLHPKQLCSGRCLHKRQLCFQDAWGVGVPGGRDERQGLAKLLCKPRQQYFNRTGREKANLSLNCSQQRQGAVVSNWPPGITLTGEGLH